MKKVGVIIAARLGSSRLPGKALLPLKGLPMIVFLIRRLKTRKRGSKLILATTLLEEDDRLAEAAGNESIDVFRGESEDVVKRHVDAARQYGLEYVVRVTGDCPFVSGSALDYCLAECERKGVFDLATTKGSFPVGIDFEIYRAEAMEELHREELTDEEREHLTLGIYRRRERYDVFSLKPPSSWRKTKNTFTVDTKEDYGFAKALMQRCGDMYVDIPELLALCGNDSADSIKADLVS